MKFLLTLCVGVLLLMLAGCASYSGEHQPIPLTPPTRPVNYPAPTPRPVATPQPDAAEYYTEPEGLPPLFEIPPFSMTHGYVTDDFNEKTATQWVAAITMGWNLGNTLDSHGGPGGFAWLGGGYYRYTSVEDMELAWVGHLTTRSNIQAVAAAGFNTIRIPVTWFKALDDDLNIREDWMARVIEIVDWSLEAGLKVILNTHHDEYIFTFLDEGMQESQYYFARVWQQIAYTFRDYNEQLMFESLNEPRTIGTPGEWTGGTAEERNNLNILNQLFVDIVRDSGGNNAYRVLMVPTYAASATPVAQRALVLPYDTVQDRLVVSLHIYAPWEFALRTGDVGIRYTWEADNASDTNPIVEPLQLAYEIFVSQGVPVIIGEMGALNRGNEAYRAEWAYFFISYARTLGMPSIWWDNGIGDVSGPNPWGSWDETFGLLDRATNTWMHPLVMEAIRRAIA